jgi:hypothetical protein
MGYRWGMCCCPCLVPSRAEYLKEYESYKQFIKEAKEHAEQHVEYHVSDTWNDDIGERENEDGWSRGHGAWPIPRNGLF